MGGMPPEDLGFSSINDAVTAITMGKLVIVVEDLAEDPGGEESRQPRQVHRRLGVAGAPEDAALLGDDGGDVTGPHQVFRPRARVDDRLDRRAALVGGDAGPAARRIDRHGEGGALRSGILLRGRVQPKLLGAVPEDGDAELAAAVGLSLIHI